MHFGLVQVLATSLHWQSSHVQSTHVQFGFAQVFVSLMCAAPSSLDVESPVVSGMRVGHRLLGVARNSGIRVCDTLRALSPHESEEQHP